MITIAMIDNIAKRITAEITPIWRCDLNRITRKLREPAVLLVLQPEIVIFMAVGRLVGGSGRHERGPACGVATTTSATGGLDQLRGRRPVRRTGAGSRCRSTGSAPTVVGGGRAR